MYPEAFTRIGETFSRPIIEATAEELMRALVPFRPHNTISHSERLGLAMVKCPHCGNDNPSMIETRNHRREQMDCHCEVCAKDWVEVFTGVPKENIIPKEQQIPFSHGNSVGNSR